MDFIEFLMSQGGRDSDREEIEMPSEKEQIRQVNNFLERKIDFKVGERVVRNEDGERRYRFPKKEQVCIVVSVFDTPRMDKEGSIVHGEIASVIKTKGTPVVAWAVDFRYYKRRPHLAVV